MEIGEFHNRDGWYFKRVDEAGTVRIRKRVTGHDGAEIVTEIEIPENEWASIVAHVSRRGETSQTWQQARSLHGEGQTYGGAGCDLMDIVP